MSALTILNATIAKINEHGFQTKERPGVWINLSKYATPMPEIPPPGTEVELAMDTSGFVREIRPANGTHSAPTSEPARSTPPSSREIAITRLAVLKAAARFLADRTDAKSADVLTVAASWEGWINR